MNLESSKSTKGLAIYDLFGYHASRASVSAAILDFEKCSRVNSIYPTDYVYGISRTSKSVEKKTISIKSGFSLKITFGCLTNNVFGLVSHVSLCGDEISQFISHLTEYYIRKKNNIVFKGI